MKIETDNKRELAQEATKQYVAKARAEETITAREQLVSQEKTKRTKIGADNKRELAQEETKQFQAKARAEEAITARARLVAQEKTKQMEIEADNKRELAQERTKQIEYEERTKLQLAQNETFTQCIKFTEAMQSKGISNQAIEGIINHMFGSSEKVKKVAGPPRASRRESAQSRFNRESINKELKSKLPQPVNNWDYIDT